MRRAPVWLRNLFREMRPAVALLLTAILVWGAVSRVATVTPRGVQCPTAVVQAVVVAKRDCCDRIVGYEVRKPREGETGFKQCRCAEKDRGALQADASPRHEAISSAPLALTVPPVPPLPRVVHAYAASHSDWRLAPPTRPPTVS